METWRRGILLVCVCLAIWMAKFAVLKPLLTLEAVDFAKEQADERTWTEEQQRLKGLPLAEYIAEKTKGSLAEVSGLAWERLYAGIRAADANESGGKEWLRRVSADERRWGFSGKSYFFRPAEEPVVDISGRLRNNADILYLALATAEKISYLEAQFHVFSVDDFHFGSGFSHMPKPPAAFLFPFRKFGLPVILLGLAVYVFLPRRKREKESISYPHWRLILGDFASFLLFVPFFALPFFIVGGSVQALTQGWMFCLVLWPLAFLGLWLLRRNVWYADYEIMARNEELLLRVGRKVRSIPYAEIESCQPLDLRAPRWLTVASALAALGGRGAASAGSAGRAFLLAGSAYGGLGLRMKDGSRVYIWVTDAMGTTALKNTRAMMKKLDDAGIAKINEPERLRSIAIPTGRDAAGKILKEGSEAVVWILAALPVAVMLGFLLLVIFG